MATGFPTKANWAAGDILTASALDDLAGTVNLLSNASATSGSQLLSNAAGTSFAYQATPSSSNPILNSSFTTWQRGTSGSAQSASAASGYNADRWQNYSGANAITVSRQATSDTTNLPSIQYCARVQRNSGQTSGNAIYHVQTVESVNSIPFAGKPIVMSFYARLGANYSATSNALSVYLNCGTGTDQNLIAGFTGNAGVIATTVTLTSTWQRFTATATMPATATEFGLGFYYTPTGTAGTNDYFEVTGVQIDIGSVALPFRTYAATYQGELAACQRYLPVLNIGTKVLGVASSTTQSYVYPTFPVTARVAPTGITPSPTLSNYYLTSAGLVNGTPTAITFSSASVDGAQIGVTTTAGSPTIAVGQADWLTLISATILFTGCEL
jgi:hypothetical protein